MATAGLLDRRPATRRGALGLGVALMATSVVVAAAPPLESAEPPLVPGLPHEGSLAGGEEASFRLDLAGGRTWQVTVVQEGVDLALTLEPPDPEPEITVDAPLGRYGPETLVIRPPASGRHHLRIRPTADHAVRGRFRLELRELTDALADGDERARLRRRSAEAASEAGEQSALGTAESRRLAVDRYGEVLELRRQLGDRRGQALARTALGALARRLGEPRLALGHLGEALELWRAEGDRRRTAITLNDLGLTLLELGDREAAAERLAEAAAEHAAIGADHGEAVARNNLCLMHLSAGDPATARPCFEGAIELFAAADERRGEALARNSLAGVYDQLGEPGSALEELERAHRLVAELGDRRGQAHLLANRAALHRRLGEPRAALADYGRALPILRQLDDRRWLARTVNNLGFAYLELGEPERARGFFGEALELRLEVGDPLGEAVTRNNLGRVHRQLGEPAAAWRAHRKAEELLTRLDDRERLATTRSLAGEALLDLGEPAAALASFERALELDGTTGERRRRRGNVLVRTAWAHLALGDAGAAMRRLDEAQALFRTLDDRDGEAEARVVAAKAHLALGRLDDALATVDRALSHFESQREGIVNPRLQATFLDAHRRGDELKVEILMARHRADPTAGFAERALAAVESSRARVLRHLLASSDASLGVPAELSTRRRDLLRRLRIHADRRRQLLDAGKRTEAEDAQREVAQLLTALDVLDAEIERRRPGFAELTAGRPFDLPRLRATLGDAVLLEYALGEERSYLWRVTASDLEVFELPPRSHLEAAARAAYLELRTVTAGEEEGGAVREVAELLLSPVWHRLSGRRLSIVPDGALHHLPFGALPGVDGRPLAVDHEVVHLPAAPPLAARRRAEGAAAGRSIAVLADPVFSRDDPRLRGAPGAAGQADDDDVDVEPPPYGELPRLPATRREAAAIVDAAPPGTVDVALGFEVDLEALRAGRWSRHRILHLATHGVIDDRHPELSGALLSRFDAEGRERPGFLGLHELYELRLDAVLVVLSGCETAAGRQLAGEGLVGLTRGFLYAGARQVVATLWPVEDRVTAEWMAVFYRELLARGRSPAAALRAAQLEIRARRGWRDPYYWAAFVLIGDGGVAGHGSR